MKQHVHHISKKITEHTKNTVRQVRAKPYHVRMQVIRLLTVLASFIVVLFWVMLLKWQFRLEPEVKQREIEKTKIISEGVLRVYDESKNVIDKKENN